MTGLYILLSVVCATLLFVFFKVFSILKLNTPVALVINYLVAAVFGIILLPDSQEFFAIYNRTWFWMSCVLGFMFISLFYLMALISQKVGVSAASVATKMSVVIPVIAAVFLYGDSMGTFKIFGILLSLISVWMATTKRKTAIPKGVFMWLPLVLFLGAGLLDTFLKLSESHLVPAEDELYFIPSIFAMAFVAGIILKPLLPKKEEIGASKYKTWLGGIVLGLVNYGSIFFIWKALSQDGVESSMVFPVANMGIVAATTLSGWLVFKEDLSLKNWSGIVLALISIGLIAWFT